MREDKGSGPLDFLASIIGYGMLFIAGLIVFKEGMEKLGVSKFLNSKYGGLPGSGIVFFLCVYIFIVSKEKYVRIICVAVAALLGFFLYCLFAS
ncbi:MAG TPA: hypothetical protein VFW07_01480 [Parafilimonas sp.]|nr:hypothetical protein [Parafilimonas sp.]